MPDFEVDTSLGDYAPGSFVRRLQSLPFHAASGVGHRSSEPSGRSW